MFLSTRSLSSKGCFKIPLCPFVSFVLTTIHGKVRDLINVLCCAENETKKVHATSKFSDTPQYVNKSRKKQFPYQVIWR